MSLQIPILGDLTGLQAALRNIPGMVGNALQQANFAGRSAFNSLFSGLRNTVIGFSSILKSSLVNAVGAVGIVQSFRSAIQQLDKVGDLSQRFGIGSEALQRLGGVAELSGSSMDSMARALSKLGRTMTEAVMDPAGQAAQKFGQLGISVDQLKGKAIDEVFMMVAQRISELSSETEQGAAAFDIFGKAGEDIRNVLQLNNDELQRMAEGMAIASEESVAAAQQIDDTFKSLGQSFTGVIGSMLSAFRPAILFILDGLEQMAYLARIAVEGVKSVFTGQGLGSQGLMDANQAYAGLNETQRARRIQAMTDRELEDLVAGSDQSAALQAGTELERRTNRSGLNTRNLSPIPVRQVKPAEEKDPADSIFKNMENIISSGRGIEKGQIIADSLARIGGGGSSVLVGQSDREQQRLLQEQLKALKKIESNTAVTEAARLK